MTPCELRRLYFIVRVFLSYGLDELIPKMRLTLPLRFGRRLLFWMPNRHKDKPLVNACGWRCRNWGRSGSSSAR